MCTEMADAASIVVGRIAAMADQDPEFRVALATVLDGMLDRRQPPNDKVAKVEEVSPSVEPCESSQTELDSDAIGVPTETHCHVAGGRSDD